jgi:hypothetical protein
VVAGCIYQFPQDYMIALSACKGRRVLFVFTERHRNISPEVKTIAVNEVQFVSPNLLAGKEDASLMYCFLSKYHYSLSTGVVFPTMFEKNIRQKGSGINRHGLNSSISKIRPQCLFIP